MSNVSLMRARCYTILQGLERSIVDSIESNLDINDWTFLTKAEIDRALGRFKEDMQDSGWRLADVEPIDLLSYLDLGDLIGLLNRHKSTLKNATRSDLKALTATVNECHIHAIRNRVMHPVRPLESEDFDSLISAARRLSDDAPGLQWNALLQSIELLSDPLNVADITIPPYWSNESRISHNLPVAEFDETGFIGRREERRRLAKLLQSHHNVITVVGAGGIGKTALALRVCHDILDDTTASFDSIIWISLKTHRLTVDGVQEIVDAVDTTDHLIDRISSSITNGDRGDHPSAWNLVLEHMKINRILLVIDNLETLGADIRELAIDVPPGSKLLLTSRVGLGELELRYSIPEFSPMDASRLMRSLGAAHGYQTIKQLDNDLVNDFCKRLHRNPLLIKWFVQAVGRGAHPQDILSRHDFDEAIMFCLANVYERLSRSSKNIIATLLAARRNLSQAQIREITQIERIPFEEALLELRQSNIVEVSGESRGTGIYRLGSLVLDYLSRNHPPDNRTVENTRELLRKWQIEQDESAVRRNVYRYSKTYVHIETVDHRISAPYLREALVAVASHELSRAETCLDRAHELTPDWFEVHRVKARLLELKQHPIYDVENSYEDSIKYGDNDISRRHYAIYLMSIHEYERALEQIEAALSHSDGLELVLKSLKGVVLTRLGRLDDALSEFKYVWECRETNPSNYDRIIQGTQHADTLRRYVEQLIRQGKNPEAKSALGQGIVVTEKTAEECGWDSKLADVGVRLLSIGILNASALSLGQDIFAKIGSRWDSNSTFAHACVGRKAQFEFSKLDALARAMPKAAKYEGSMRVSKSVGRVRMKRDNFGFIESERHGSVHMSMTSLVRPSEWSSLRPGQKVSFEVVIYTKGPHAVKLEIAQDSAI